MTNYKAIITAFSAIFIIASSTQSAFAENGYSIGVEGFYDNYQESSLDLDNDAYYGSVNLTYDYTWSKYFTEFSVRASYGENDYSSPSGIVNDVPQYEGEFRITGGVVPNDRGFIQPYYGIGTRLFYDNGKNRPSNTGALGYDRRIAQFYAPIGLWYQNKGDYFDISSKAELDIPLFGIVESRLQNAVGAGFPNIVNHQRIFEGYGLRGEIMLSKTLGKYTLQAGPFIRYWHFGDSQTTPSSIPGYVFIEPENDRLQAGAQVKLLW